MRRLALAVLLGTLLALPAQAEARSSLSITRAETAISAAEARWWPSASSVEVVACHRVSATSVRCEATALVGWSTTCGDVFVSGEDEAKLWHGKVSVYLAATRV
jgi:hypothetical protein